MVYYHVADFEWAGEDLLSYNRLCGLGHEPRWKWDEADCGFDGDVVCLFDSIEDADTFRTDYCPNGKILKIELSEEDAEIDAIRFTRNGEGYTCVLGMIPARYVSLAE